MLLPLRERRKRKGIRREAVWGVRVCVRDGSVEWGYDGRITTGFPDLGPSLLLGVSLLPPTKLLMHSASYLT